MTSSKIITDKDVLFPPPRKGVIRVIDVYPAGTVTATMWMYKAIRSTQDGGKRLWQAGFDGRTGEVITTFGVDGGKMQTSRKAVVVNTSGRDIGNQALQEVNHKYKLKMVKDGFTFDSVVATAAKERPFPMLARDFGKRSAKVELKFPLFVQPKLDGIRCLIDTTTNDDGKKTILRFSSRGRNDFGHLSELFEADVKAIMNGIKYKDAILDGELIVSSLTGCGEDFQETTSAARTVKGGLTDAAKERMTFNVFGVYIPSYPLMDFLERDAMLSHVFSKLSSSLSSVKKVPTKIIHSEEEIKTSHDSFVEECGHEGAMVYLADGIYEPGKRSSYLLKVKEFDETEGKIVAVRPGKGREKDAAMVDIEVSEGVVITMHPTGSIEERKLWLSNPELVVGKQMTYKFQGLTKDGKPRFPIAKTVRDYE